MPVKPELFLEDVGKIVSSTGGKNVWEVKNLSKNPLFKGQNLPKTIYVIDFPGRGIGQEFLLGRHMCGPSKFLMIQGIGHSMIRLFKEHFVGRIAQFVILWGGRPLDLLDANPPLYEADLVDTTYIKLTRVEDKSAPRGWKIVKSSVVGQWWPNDTWLVMEECIASGKTLQYFIDEALQAHRPQKLFLFPVCASADGLEAINEACEKNGVEFVPVLNEAIIEVAKVGVNKPYTDLGLRPKTIITKNFYDQLNTRYQGTSLCWVGDIGDSLYKPFSYLEETLADMIKIGMDLNEEDFSSWPSLVRTENFHNFLKIHDSEVYASVTKFISNK